MSIIAPIQPAYTRGQVVSATSSSAQADIIAQSKQVCVTNLGTNVAYIRIGQGVFSATTADMPILPGSQVTVSKGMEDSKIAYISASGSSLHIITGEGF